jgi:hypothetical protein
LLASLLIKESQIKGAQTEVMILESHSLMLEKRLAHYQTSWTKVSKNLTRLRRKLKASTRASQRRHAAALKAAQQFSLKIKGVYSNSACKLMCKLLAEGIPALRVASVIAACARTFGINVDKLPSQRTASWAVSEGGIAAELQMAVEMQNTRGKHISIL